MYILWILNISHTTNSALYSRTIVTNSHFTILTYVKFGNHVSKKKTGVLNLTESLSPHSIKSRIITQSIYLQLSEMTTSLTISIVYSLSRDKVLMDLGLGQLSSSAPTVACPNAETSSEIH